MNISLKNLIKIFIDKNHANSKNYISYLKRRGAVIGENTYFWDTHSVNEGRAEYLTVGNNCSITQGVKILMHDFSWVNHITHSLNFSPTGGGQVIIGNNVFIGWNSIIMPNVKIGNNVIIGAGSIITKNIPDNVVVGGNPARYIMSIDELSKKRKKEFLKNAKNEVLTSIKRKNEIPSEKDMMLYSSLFLDREKRKQYLKHIELKVAEKDSIEQSFLKEKNIFNSYEEFLNSFLNE